MKVSYSLETEFTFEPAVSSHVFRLRASPPAGNRQRVFAASLSVTPAARCAELIEPPMGNHVFVGRIDVPHEKFGFVSKGEAVILPDRFDTAARPGWLAYASGLTHAGEELRRLAREMGTLPEDREAAIDRMLAAAHGAIRYKSGVTTTETTAEEALRSGSGVCQDFSHILLALLRMQRIPCCYVAGLVGGIGSTHAWVEAWTGDRWLPVDPTSGLHCSDSHLTLARGADFTQAAIESGLVSQVSVQTIRTKASLQPIQAQRPAGR